MAISRVLHQFNLSFSNDELQDLHLCLHAPKLDLKVATVQVVGASLLTSLTQELVDADFLARGPSQKQKTYSKSRRRAMIKFLHHVLPT